MRLKLKLQEAEYIAKQLNYRYNGLILAIAQDIDTSEVLMVAHMDIEAVKQTLTTGLAHYFSLERRKLWLKGELSRHHQRVKEVRIDCDGDAMLLKVKQIVGACHLGYKSCFFRRLRRGKFETVLPQIFKPEKVYRKRRQLR